MITIIKDLGGWPVLEGDKWDQNKFNWLKSLFQLRKLGFGHNMFMSIYSSHDLRNNSRNILHVI